LNRGRRQHWIIDFGRIRSRRWETWKQKKRESVPALYPEIGTERRKIINFGPAGSKKAKKIGCLVPPSVATL